MSENPLKTSSTKDPDSEQIQFEASDGRDTYNIVSDTIIGVNVRRSDNLLQAIAVFACMLLLAIVGAILAALKPSLDLPWYGGAMLGAFAGMVFGILLSGAFLMVYRAARHLLGEHD